MQMYVVVAAFSLLTCLSAAIARTTVYQAEDAKLNSARVVVVTQASFPDNKGVALKPDVQTNLNDGATAADIVFTVDEPADGRFVLVTHTAIDTAGVAVMKSARTKFDSLQALLQIGDDTPTWRVVYVPWSAPENCRQTLGIFTLPSGKQDIKIWLPHFVRLDRLEVHPYRAPAVPPAAAKYQPRLTPPTGHPRIWVTSNTLAQVRANLEHPEHVAQWQRVQAQARKKFDIQFPESAEMPYNTALEQAAYVRAFVYLMQGDTTLGQEAVHLTREYLQRVSFGNLLDITRETGCAIYTASCVYDWCYPLLSAADRALFLRHLLRLAEEMECGWPPFKGTVVNGHGNEAMTNRDLFCMSLALYDEQPELYQYCAWRLLEELVPQRRFEYNSPRHNQGISYASYRFGWEMHAAWLLRRMSNQEVFDPNIKSVPLYWLYMRLPNGEMLRDGDGVPSGRYYNYAQTALLCYTYGANPIVKGEFMRQGGKARDPLLFLLLNDPALKAEMSLASLPLTIDFGPVLCGMIARTDWNCHSNINNSVVAEIKGGGYHFGNHQHADAGAIQLYYRGLQVADLGQYGFYGTPYDVNFNKRSIAHSMLLVYDPDEKFLNTAGNDGGSRYIQRHPTTPQVTQSQPLFNYGRKLSCGWGPSLTHPDYSYFAVDLTAAYSNKISRFTRSFCFLNLGLSTHPACVIVLDNVRTDKAEFKKYWQVNTLKPPVRTPQGVSLFNTVNSVTGRVDVSMLLPTAHNLTLEVKSDDAVYDIFGLQVQPPNKIQAEANGHRVLFSPKVANVQDTFLALLQTHEDGVAPLKYAFEEAAEHVVLYIADRVVCMARGASLLKNTVRLNVPHGDKEYQVVVAGLAPGAWQVEHPGGVLQIACATGNHTLHFTARGGKCSLTPVK